MRKVHLWEFDVCMAQRNCDKRIRTTSVWWRAYFLKYCILFTIDWWCITEPRKLVRGVRRLWLSSGLDWPLLALLLTLITLETSQNPEIDNVQCFLCSYCSYCSYCPPSSCILGLIQGHCENHREYSLTSGPCAVLYQVWQVWEKQRSWTFHGN